MSDLHEMRMSALAAQRKLDELDQHREMQQQLPALRAERDRILAEKADVAEKVRRFGAPERFQLSAAEVYRRYSPEFCQHPPPDFDDLLARARERDVLHDRLVALNIELNGINAEISRIPPPMAPSDKAAHVEDLHRRVGA